jgi:hypothetical protein
MPTGACNWTGTKRAELTKANSKNQAGRIIENSPCLFYAWKMLTSGENYEEAAIIYPRA